jgi:hypothetical protein
MIGRRILGKSTLENLGKAGERRDRLAVAIPATLVYDSARKGTTL